MNQIAVEIEGKEPGSRSLGKILELGKNLRIKIIFVQKQFSEIGTVVQIDIRGKLYDAQIVKMPFYIRS